MFEFPPQYQFNDKVDFFHEWMTSTIDNHEIPLENLGYYQLNTVDEQILNDAYHEIKTIDEQTWNNASYQLETMDEETLNKWWNLEDLFGNIVVINLPEAKNRLKRMSTNLNKIGLYNYEVFKAINGEKELDASIWQKMHKKREHMGSTTPKGRRGLVRFHKGEAGCYMSHYSVIKAQKENFDKSIAQFFSALAAGDNEGVIKAAQAIRKYRSVLILEDDCEFGILDKNGKQSSLNGLGVMLRKALVELPKDWDMLYFEVNPKESTEWFSSHLYKIKKSWSALAYAVNYKMYGPLLEHLQKIEDPSVTEVEPLDYAISSIHHLHKVYAICPSIAYHQWGRSQISKSILMKGRQGNPIYP